MKLTYIRWSMTIIETSGLTIITDPVFRIFGMHQAPRSYTFERMPRPDLVFISHTHINHFAPSVLGQLDPSTPVWMPADKVHRASRLGLAALRGVREWESIEFNGIRLTPVPGFHAGGELGLVIEGDRTVYFAGHHWNLDAALLPIGDLHSMGLPFRHIGPRRVPQALRLLGEPRFVVPTHYSGMTLGPLMYFKGTPRKLAEVIGVTELGTIIGTTRPLEIVEL